MTHLRGVFFGHISNGIGQDLSSFADLASDGEHALVPKDDELPPSHAVLIIKHVADARAHGAARRRDDDVAIDVRLERSDLI